MSTETGTSTSPKRKAIQTVLAQLPGFSTGVIRLVCQYAEDQVWGHVVSLIKATSPDALATDGTTLFLSSRRHGMVRTLSLQDALRPSPTSTSVRFRPGMAPRDVPVFAPITPKTLCTPAML